MKVIVEFVDMAGNPVAQPNPLQLEQWANEFAKSLLRVRYPEILFQDVPSSPTSNSPAAPLDRKASTGEC
jgi:hypothetical protein